MSAPTEEPSHSTDQPGGNWHGQVKLATMSSKGIPKNSATGKTEYTNTQQGLPVIGYTLVRLLDMQSFLAEGVCFAEKATNSMSLISVFSFHNSSSNNHSK